MVDLYFFICNNWQC